MFTQPIDLFDNRPGKHHIRNVDDELRPVVINDVVRDIGPTKEFKQAAELLIKAFSRHPFVLRKGKYQLY